MAEKRQFFHIFLILLISSSTFAERNFDIIFDDIKCSTDNRDYVKYHSCSVDKSGDIPVLNVDIQMQKEVQEFRLDFAVYALTVMKKKFTAYKVDGVNYCDLQAEETIIAPIFKSFYDMLQRAGTLPSSCPIPANFLYSFKNLSINTDILPFYTPKVKIRVILVYYNRKSRFFTITTLGKIEYTRKKIETKNSRKS